MVPRVIIISGKASIESASGAGGSGGSLSPSAGVFRKFLGSKEHLDCLKIDLNAAEIITAQDYKYTKS